MDQNSIPGAEFSRIQQDIEKKCAPTFLVLKVFLVVHGIAAGHLAVMLFVGAAQGVPQVLLSALAVISFAICMRFQGVARANILARRSARYEVTQEFFDLVVFELDIPDAVVSRYMPEVGKPPMFGDVYLMVWDALGERGCND